jgi:hypothetical protein
VDENPELRSSRSIDGGRLGPSRPAIHIGLRARPAKSSVQAGVEQ